MILSVPARSVAVMNVAMWPSKQARCPSHFHTWPTSFQQSMAIEIHTFAWQLAIKLTDIDSKQAHNFDSIVGDWQIFGDRRSRSTKMNTCRSVTDENKQPCNEPVSECTNCLQAVRYLTKCHWNYRGTTRETHRSSRLKVVILSQSTGVARRETTVVRELTRWQIRSPFHPGMHINISEHVYDSILDYL